MAPLGRPKPKARSFTEVRDAASEHGELVHESGGGDERVGHPQAKSPQLACLVGHPAIDEEFVHAREQPPHGAVVRGASSEELGASYDRIGEPASAGEALDTLEVVDAHVGVDQEVSHGSIRCDSARRGAGRWSRRTWRRSHRPGRGRRRSLGARTRPWSDSDGWPARRFGLVVRRSSRFVFAAPYTAGSIQHRARQRGGVQATGRRLIPWMNGDSRMAGSSVASMSGIWRRSSENAMVISRRARLAPRQKWAPPAP
jgi:hypothetical protein